jgi:protein phosphatase-4 regulatory subunit 3
VVPIGNQATLANIHFYYRLKYFKEVILNRTLDEAGFALMTFLLQNKNVEIINYVSRDSAYLTSLFHIAKSEDVNKKRDLVAYLQNFCNQVKEIPPQMKTGIFKYILHIFYKFLLIII